MNKRIKTIATLRWCVPCLMYHYSYRIYFNGKIILPRVKR